MRVRVRGIYATALTRTLLTAGHEVVDASPPIRERFDAAFPTAVPDLAIRSSDDRQGVGIAGAPDAVGEAVGLLRDVGRDALAWADPAPPGAVFDARVTETLGAGAVCDLGAPGSAPGAVSEGGPGEDEDQGEGGRERPAALPAGAGEGGAVEGFLPFDRTDRHVTVGDQVRVQVTESAQPWSDHRPELDATIRARAGPATLVRGREGTAVAAGDDAAGRELAGLTDLFDVDVPDGWGIRWERAAADADMDALADALAAAAGRAERIDAALDRADGGGGAAEGGPGDGSPGDSPGDEGARAVVRPRAGAWVWFGREARFALDERRRAVAPTMPGHHRIKAADRAASAGVDLAEALCAPDGDEEFPFAAVARQFGPREGDAVRIAHGKPDGRVIDLGRGEVTDREADGTVTVRRELSGGGQYDALDVPKEAGDVAVTTVREGRWWYPTVYRDAEGAVKGTYVNVCTPVECFPDAVRYVDLHVDVIRHADGDVERVDDEELDAAVDADYVPPALAERARSVAAALVEGL